MTGPDLPYYTLGDDEDLQISVFDQYADFCYYSFLVVRPEDSVSAAREVWLAGTENGDELLPIRKQLELRSPWITDIRHVKLILNSLAFGYEVGEHDGAARIQSLNRFAHSVLLGDLDTSEMYELAHKAGFGIEEDGSSFGSKLDVLLTICPIIYSVYNEIQQCCYVNRRMDGYWCSDLGISDINCVYHRSATSVTDFHLRSSPTRCGCTRVSI